MDEENTGGFIASHPTLLIGGLVVGLLLLVAYFSNKKKNSAAGGSTSQDLSGIATDSAGNHVVYVPTSTSFTTENIGAQYSNNPNLQSITSGDIITNSPINQTRSTSTKGAAPVVVGSVAVPITNPPITPPPVTPLPTGGTVSGGVTPVKSTPAPAPARYGIVWNYPYVVGAGDTLSGIASNITAAARKAGMPAGMAITWQDIYNYNKAVIDSTAAAHGNPIPGGPQNNIFPGEHISLAGWTKL